MSPPGRPEASSLERRGSVGPSVAQVAPATSKARAWDALLKWAPWLLMAVVLVLIARQVHTIDWPQVWDALRAQPRTGLVGAVGLSLATYALFSSYDLIGKHETGHAVPTGNTLGIAAVCCAFNVNFGSLVGALAMKLRLYGRAGLPTPTILRVIALSVATNWLGYLAVGGAVLLLAPPPFPPQLAVVADVAPWVGAGMLALAVAYPVWCARAQGRSFRIRGKAFTMPHPAMATWQLAISSAHWMAMSSVVWLLLRPHHVPYTLVLGVMLLAAIAGVASHVPAGLGVLEAVFVASLAGRVPAETVLAALLAYRGAYYLVPLAIALVGYAGVEMVLRRGRR